MSFKARVKQRLLRMERRSWPWLARHPRTAGVFLSIVDPALTREAAAVMAGRTAYHSDLEVDSASYALLRRNVHRLEKGLIMRPRREVFALDYLEETISIYRRSMQAVTGEHTVEHRWATDVLRQYFDVVDRSHPVIANALEEFRKAAANAPNSTSGQLVPFARVLPQEAVVTYSQLSALAEQRRSVRWFLPKPVPRELVDSALEIALQAPSACNRQPFFYHIIDDPERARSVAAIPMGTKGFAEHLQCLVVLIGNLRAYPETRDRHVIYIDGALSAMSFMFALETVGLSSCPINWPDMEPQESRMKEALGLEPHERIVMLIAYGFPDPEGLVPRSVKIPLEQARSYE